MPSRSRPAGDLTRALQHAADIVHAEVAACADPDRVLVLVDGRSGAGKTSFAALLAARWPTGGAQVLALDSLYPAWEGLTEGARYATENVIIPYAAGQPARWRRWDWERSERAEEHAIEPDRGLVIEGCGILTAEAASRAPIRIWLEAPADTRRERALARDGESFRVQWERWARQEDEHILREDPRRLATHEFLLP